MGRTFSLAKFRCRPGSRMRSSCDCKCNTKKIQKTDQSVENDRFDFFLNLSDFKQINDPAGLL